MTTTFYLQTDGGARGNPGPAGSGAVLFDHTGAVVGEWSRYVGETTNNQAEYKALIGGLEMAIEKGVKTLVVRMDSQLIVNQVKGTYRVKDAGLKLLFASVLGLTNKFDSITFYHIPREQNKHADRLVNEAIDNH